MTIAKNSKGMYKNGVPITKEQYNEILAVIDKKPSPPPGKEYHLTDELIWELYDLPPMEEYELTDEELGRMVREGMM